MSGFLKKYKIDILLIIIVLITSILIGLLLYIFNNSDKEIAQIYVSNELKETINLKEETETRYIEVNGKHGLVKIEVKKDEIRIIESTCPNKDCIFQGEATSLKPLICAYNEVLIKIESFEDVDVELG